MLTAQEVAEKMNDCVYKNEDMFTDSKLAEANLVVVYGASDDLIEFRGAIVEEIDAYQGAIVYLYSVKDKWRLITGDQIEELEDTESPLLDLIPIEDIKAHYINGLFCPKGFSGWLIEAKLPNGMASYPFSVLQDGDVTGRGLVIDMNTL